MNGTSYVICAKKNHFPSYPVGWQMVSFLVLLALSSSFFLFFGWCLGLWRMEVDQVVSYSEEEDTAESEEEVNAALKMAEEELQEARAVLQGNDSDDHVSDESEDDDQGGNYRRRLRGKQRVRR